MTVLAVDNLFRSFGGIHAVDGVTFDIEQSEIVGIIGPNGSGKSTLFNLLTGALKPDAGTIMLFGRDVTRLAPYKIARVGLGRTFQIPALFVNMTVRENLWTAAVKFDWNNARDDANAVLERLELTHVADDLARSLSGGPGADAEAEGRAARRGRRRCTPATAPDHAGRHPQLA